MRKRLEYARAIKKLFTKLKRAGGKVDFPSFEDPMEQLLHGGLSTFASPSRADAALVKLHDAIVDLNELRVTPIAEIVEIIGVDYPKCRKAAEEVSRILNAVFNRIHGLDLSFLKTSYRRPADAFLNSLDGVGAHAKATVMLCCLKAHVIPVDVYMHAFLQKSGCIPVGASVEDAQKFLARQIKERDAVSFYVLLKRYAATHAPRKPVTKKSVAAAEAAPKRGVTTVKKKPGRPRTKKSTGRKVATKKKAASATSARTRKATAKKTTKKGVASSKKAGSVKKSASHKPARQARKASTGRRR